MSLLAHWLAHVAEREHPPAKDELAAAAALGYLRRPGHPWPSKHTRPEVSRPDGARVEPGSDSGENRSD